jgi:hypothetical protein
VTQHGPLPPWWDAGCQKRRYRWWRKRCLFFRPASSTGWLEPREALEFQEGGLEQPLLGRPLARIEELAALGRDAPSTRNVASTVLDHGEGTRARPEARTGQEAVLEAVARQFLQLGVAQAVVEDGTPERADVPRRGLFVSSLSIGGAESPASSS